MGHIHIHQVKCDRCGAIEDGDEARNWCSLRASVDRRRMPDGELTGGPQTEAELCPKCAGDFAKWLGDAVTWKPPLVLARVKAADALKAVAP
jgi:hypothetical protein